MQATVQKSVEMENDLNLIVMTVTKGIQMDATLIARSRMDIPAKVVQALNQAHVLVLHHKDLTSRQQELLICSVG